ncbi:hypothetical protein QT971_01295 [Microcoleus sp. herbarium19]
MKEEPIMPNIMVLPQQVITKIEYENQRFQAGSLIPGFGPSESLM